MMSLEREIESHPAFTHAGTCQANNEGKGPSLGVDSPSPTQVNIAARTPGVLFDKRDKT